MAEKDDIEGGLPERRHRIRRRRAIAALLTGGSVFLAGCRGPQDNPGSETAASDEPYRNLENALHEVSKPWETTAETISYQMAERMMEEARNIAAGAAVPNGLAASEFVDIALAFRVSMNIVDQGTASFDREKYRYEAKAVHSSSDLSSSYAVLPETSYDNQKPYNALFDAAEHALSQRASGEIEETDLQDRMGAIYAILHRLWSGVETARDSTTTSWETDEEACVTIDGEERCGTPSGEPFYNSLRFLRIITDGLQ